MFSTTVFVQGLPLLLHAALATIGISLTGLLIGFFVAVGVCAARLSTNRAARMFGGAYVFFFRGVPMLVQLLLVYYLLPFAGINVSPVVAAISAVSLCSASYIAEILRGGFLSVLPGHLEAARMLGLSPFDMLRRILVPQAFRLTLPSLVNEMVLLIKASSLISVVGVAELTRTAQNIAASTYRPLEAYLAA
ncbi:MAG TPA: amino acid ABC transporter permease, partial [Paraburkholderia sp.]|nr:amino acid ABC transporter permease [Paraburkholderia sp.]